MAANCHVWIWIYGRKINVFVDKCLHSQREKVYIASKQVMAMISKIMWQEMRDRERWNVLSYNTMECPIIITIYYMAYMCLINFSVKL